MLSYLASEIKHYLPKSKVIVETQKPELFLHNPKIDKIFFGKVAPFYHKAEYLIDAIETTHILSQMRNRLPLPAAERPPYLEIFLQPEERMAVRQQMPESYIVVAPAGKQTFARNRKEWSFERFTQVRDFFSNIPFVQLGGPDDPLLPDTIDRRGRPIRETAAIIENATTGLFLEGGMMHLANAVGKPCVIIFGGAIDPRLSGYDMHINLASKPHCSPCFTSEQPMTVCDTMICMKAITVENVVAAVKKMITNQ